MTFLVIFEGLPVRNLFFEILLVCKLKRLRTTVLDSEDTPSTKCKPVIGFRYVLWSCVWINYGKPEIET